MKLQPLSGHVYRCDGGGCDYGLDDAGAGGAGGGNDNCTSGTAILLICILIYLYREPIVHRIKRAYETCQTDKESREKIVKD